MAVRLASVAPARPSPAAPFTELRPTPRASSPGEWIALAILALWIPLQLLAAWPAPLALSLDGVWRFDPAIFAYEGALVLQGGVPYVSFWDHKGPLIYLIDAVGLWGSGGRIWGIWAVGLIATWIAAAVGYRAMRKSFGAPGALLGTVFFVFGLAGIVTGSNMTEQYALPLAWGAALVLVRWTRARRATFQAGLALGALGGLAFFLRANLAGAAASAGLTMALVLLHERRSGALARGALGAMAGAAIIALPVIAWLAHGGALHAFWDQAITYNLLYARALSTQRVLAAFVGLDYATATAPLLLPLAGFALAVRRLARSSTRARSYPVVLFILIWLTAELLLACTSGRPFDHYFLMLLPPMAMLTAVLVAEGVTLLPPDMRRTARWPSALVTAFAFAIALPVVCGIAERAGQLVPARSESQVIPTAAFVRSHTAPNDRLLVWGLAGGVYFLADRPPASRYLFALPLLTRPYGDSVVPHFLAELRRAPPTLIVDAAVSDSIIPTLGRWNPAWHYPHARWHAPYWSMTPSLRAFYDFVDRNYTAIATVGPERWTVYRIKTRQQSGAGRGVEGRERSEE